MRISIVEGSITTAGAGGAGPQAMWPGYQDTQSLAFEWWCPTTQTSFSDGVYTGSITSNVLTVTAVTSGIVLQGQVISGTGIPAGVSITGFISGTFYGIGKYSTSPCPNIASTTITGNAGDPDYYQVYENVGGTFVLSPGQTSPPLTNPGVTVTNGAPPNTHNPVLPYVRRNLNPGTTMNFAVKAITAGIPSAFGPTLTMTTLVNGPSATPTPPANTSWEVALQIPNVTAVVCVTQTDFQNALTNANIAGPNLIVLTAGNTFAIPNVNGYQLPAFTGTGGFTYIISSETPEYKGGGKLPAFNANAGSPVWQVVPCSGTNIPLNATSATLSTAWAQKSGWYYVWFQEGTGTAAVIEERWVVFTQGSTTIDWHLNNGHYPNPGLTAQASVTLRVFYEPSVTPWDAFTNNAMATIDLGAVVNSFGINIPPAATKVRFIGVNIKTTGTGAVGSTTQATGYIHFSNSQEPDQGGNVTPAESIYFDRCMWGNDTGSATYGFCGHGLGWVNCNHLLVSQCYGYGVASNNIASGGDSNNFTCNGGNHLWRSTYLSTVSECHIIGGIFMDNVNTPSDIHWLNCSTHKPLGWLQGVFVAVASWTPGPGSVGATGGVLAVPWAFPSGTCTVALSAESATATFTNGSTTFTFSAALTKTDTLGMNPQGTAGGNSGGLVPYWLFGREVKNHFEQKSGSRVSYNGIVARNCWVGKQAGYHGAPFAMATRDQQLSNNSAFNYTDLCPWAQTLDVDIQNCITLNCPAAFVAFTSDPSIGAYTARIRYKNNLSWISTSSLGEQMAAFWIIGPTSDVIIDQCTVITNQQIDQTTLGVPLGVHFSWFNPLSGSNANLVPFSPFSYTPYQDRLTITNSIIDSGPVGNTSNPAFFQDTVVPIPFSTFPNITFNKNVTITDTSTGYPNLAGTAVPYANLGLQNYNTNNLPPLNVSDWNVISGTLATASTTAGPVGSTFSKPQITTSSLAPAVVGSAYSQAINVAGGVGPYTLVIVSMQPHRGLWCTVNQTNTGLQGTPQYNETCQVTLQAFDSAGSPSPTVMLPLTCAASGALAIATTSLANASSGGMAQWQMLASGGVPPYVWGDTANLVQANLTNPAAGYTLQPNGFITATPTTPGTVALNPISVRDSTGATVVTQISGVAVTIDITLRMNGIDTIDGFIRIADGVAGVKYGSLKPVFSAAGGTAPYTYSLQSGNLPAGLTIGSTGTLTGTISAFPGTYYFTVQVADNAAHTATALVGMTVNPAVIIPRPSFNTGTGWYVANGLLVDPTTQQAWVGRGHDAHVLTSTKNPGLAKTLASMCRDFSDPVNHTVTTYASDFQSVANNKLLPVFGWAYSTGGTQISGSSNVALLVDSLNYIYTNRATFFPFLNTNMVWNWANEWGSFSGMSAAAMFNAYQGGSDTITSISGTTITTANGTIPSGSSIVAFIHGVSGIADQVFQLTANTGGTSFTATTSLGTGTGGTLSVGFAAARAAGITCPIMIDAPGGQNYNSLIPVAQQLQQSDPFQSCIFGYHCYNNYTPFEHQIKSVTVGNPTVVTLNNTTHAFGITGHPWQSIATRSNPVGTWFPTQTVTLQGFTGALAVLNGTYNFSGTGSGNFPGSSPNWQIRVPVNSTGVNVSGYIANSAVVIDGANPIDQFRRLALMQANNICSAIMEFGAFGVGDNYTWVDPLEIVQAAESYGLSWNSWVFDNQLGTYCTLNNTNGTYNSPSDLSTTMGQPLTMHPRLSTLALGIAPAQLL